MGIKKKNIMLKKIFLIVTSYIFFSCVSKLPEIGSDDVKLKIWTTRNTTSDSVKVFVSFENNSFYDFYFLNENYNKIGSDNLWSYIVLNPENISVWDFALVNHPFITKEQYKLLKSNDNCIFDYDINLKELISANKDPFAGKPNLNYGEYTIKLIYYDPFLEKSGAFSKKIESNEIKINYVE